MNGEQAQIYELLKCFVQICERHDLQYFLVGGTLLGAVRHQGFIPWDDDIDVAMPGEDYRHFLQLGRELPEGLAIQSEETDRRYPFLFAKLCNTKIPFDTGMSYGPKGAYIDIFPLMYSGPPNRKNRALYHLVLIIGYVLQVKCGWCSYIPYKDRVARFVFSVFSLCPTYCLKKVRKLFVKHICASGQCGRTFCSVGGVYKAKKEFYPQEWFADAVDVTFETRQCKAPCGWTEYLTQLYGDYMVMPGQELRKSSHKTVANRGEG